MKAIIISGGQISEDIALDFIKDNKDAYIIALERGYVFCLDNGIKPDLTLGDFDTIGASYAEGARVSGIEVLQTPAEKDDTDTGLAVRTALKRGYDDITILGGTGLRADHTFANICLMAEAASEYPEASLAMEDELNRYRIRNKRYSIRKDEAFGKYISFFAFGGRVIGLTLKGFKYELENKDLEGSSSLCTSNEITAEEAFVSFGNGLLLEIMSKDR